LPLSFDYDVLLQRAFAIDYLAWGFLHSHSSLARGSKVRKGLWPGKEGKQYKDASGCWLCSNTSYDKRLILPVENVGRDFSPFSFSDCLPQIVYNCKYFLIPCSKMDPLEDWMGLLTAASFFQLLAQGIPF
jgi:hypothetical protein